MDIRGPDRPSNAPCCLDLLRRYLRLFVGLRIGLDSRPHPRIAGCGGDDLFMAVGSGSGCICDLPSFWPSSGVIDLHRRISWHHRNRNDLVVACSEEQVLKLDRRVGTRGFALYDLDRNALTFYRHLTVRRGSGGWRRVVKITGRAEPLGSHSAPSNGITS
jgi:hypothetical protein